MPETLKEQTKRKVKKLLDFTKDASFTLFREITNLDEKINEIKAFVSQIDWKNLKWEKGDKGDKGEKGDRGDKGEQGSTGLTGSRGFEGKPGREGKEGKEGQKGGKGDKGDKGKDFDEKILESAKEDLKKEIAKIQPVVNSYYPRIFGGGGGSGISVAVNDVIKNSAVKKLNLKAGTNVTLTGTKQGENNVDVTITSADVAGHTIQNNSSTLALRTNLNFSGSLTATDDAVNDQSDITAARTGVYRTVLIPASAMTPRVTNGAAGATEEYAAQDIMIEKFLFDGVTEEGVQFTIAMPDEYNLGTVKMKLFWDAATGASAADLVSFGIKAGALSNDDAIDAALGTQVAVDDVVIAVGDLHVTPASGAITIGGTPALGDMVVF